MKKLLPICILLILTCYLIPDNPVDPNSSGYKAPFIIVDTMSFSDGDTITQDTVSLKFSGNLENRNLYRFQLDSSLRNDWKKLDSSEVLILKFTRADSGLHRITIETCYDPKGDISDTSFSFFKATTPQISVQPGNQQVTAGQQVTFIVTAGGSNLKYQWQKDSTVLTNDTMPTLTISKAAKSDSGKTFFCIVWNKFDTIFSSKAMLFVTSQVISPIIAVQPASATVTISQPVEFSIIATGTDLKYQWQKNGADINGAIAPKYVIISVTAQDSGTTYKCIVSNSAGLVTSDEAVLSVSKTVVKPSIYTQPASLSLKVGESATFSVAANGTNLKYQWYRDSTALSEATSSTYRISSVSSADSGTSFYCLVTNSAGEAVSSKATLSVIRTITKPLITSQPANLSLTVGQPAAFSVIASGSNLSYQWKKGTATIPDADSSTYIIPSVALTDSGAAFTCDVSNSAGKVTSSAAVLSVVSAVTIPVILAHPLALTLTEGEPAQFSVSAKGANLKYQWQKDSANITGEISSSLTIAAVVSADSGHKYRCVVSNTAGSVTSSGALLEVVKSVSLPVITQHPQNLSRIEGESALFAVSASGTNIKFQWQKDTSDIPGENKSTYTISTVSLTDNGTIFRCKVSNSAGSTISNIASLTVTAAVISPAIVTQPVSKSVITGQGATFSVVATGSSLKYQWQKDTVNITDATLPEYTIASSQLSDSGTTFRCVISNTKGTVVSSAATLSVSNNIIPPSIVTQPVNQAAIEGQPATFSVAANGTDITYQWQKDTISITNATSASFPITSAAYADSGSKYRCVVTNSKGSVASSFAILSVAKKIIAPAITVQPSDQAVTVGQPVTFTISATGTSITYQWQKDSVNISGANSTSYQIPSSALTDNGRVYRCVVTNTAGTVTSRSAILTVGQNIIPVSITQQPQPQIIRLGQTASFTIAATGTNLQYQWQKDTTNLSGQTGSTFSIAAVSATDNGASYRCIVSNSASTVTSTFANLTVAYSLTYYANGNSSGTVPVDSSKYTLNSTITVADNTGLLTKTGHHFGGWNKLSNGTGKTYNPADTLITGAANISLFAKWDIDSFTVAFNTNGGSAIASQRIAWNQLATQPTNPTKAGSVFGGWFANSTLTEPFDFNTPITSTRTVYAKWVVNYKVTYDGNGNCAGIIPVDPDAYVSGQKVTVLGNTGSLSKEGHTFVCWNTQSDTLGKNYSESDTFLIGTTNATLFAKWRPSTYTISFEAYVNGVIPAPQKVTFNGTYETLPSLARIGYIFGGWWTEMHGTGSQIQTTSLVTVAADDTLYAKWSPEKYGITYVLNGGANSVNNPDSYTIESSTISLGDAKRAGYQFNGWFSDSLSIAPVREIVAGSTGNKTLFARWIPVNYTITYVLYGGDNHLQNPATYTIETNTITLLDAKRTDWVFSGWYSDSNFVNQVTGIVTGSTENKIFYAKWKCGDGIIMDIDGNIYHTVKIGNQVWTIENIRTTRYNDGKKIPNVTDSLAWSKLSTPGYCFNNNSSSASEMEKWGALYNWYAVNLGKLAPEGWHVPTDADWDTLVNYLTNIDIITSTNKVAKLLASKTDWATSTTTGAIGNDLLKNNASGFLALPGGYRNNDGSFYYQGEYGDWWSNMENDASTAYYRNLSYNSSELRRGNYYKCSGFSIRLVRD
jgi:uncharacterized protein (TIGR02145 family)/uncharacterized repeat protein (TIGR02543 family)